ncbi:hypothetical protein CCACVL1_29825 [Corchorus capsularis]|uniref:Uncharacterized protein n=1 Tax=Corchorus capsularis TaxID=210143 RepID=A0A1R3FZX2_COCAP|nr:hypothetical protein CCACVL1_29825 [Corchorus capsularis]
MSLWRIPFPLTCASNFVSNSNNIKSFFPSLLSISVNFNRFLRHPKLSSTFIPKCSLSEGAAGNSQPSESEIQQSNGFWSKWKANSAEMSAKVAKLGLAAVLAYGLFDGVTYTTFFVLAFFGYEKSTGKNPAANLQALLGIIILMWTGNNVTRPFRVAGAAALAPFIDKGLKKIQKYFNFPNLVYAFALVVSLVASLCLTVIGLLILSRWGK